MHYLLNWRCLNLYDIPCWGLIWAAVDGPLSSKSMAFMINEALSYAPPKSELSIWLHPHYYGGWGGLIPCSRDNRSYFYYLGFLPGLNNYDSIWHHLLNMLQHAKKRRVRRDVFKKILILVQTTLAPATTFICHYCINI